MNQDAMGTPGLGDSTYLTPLSKEIACSALRNVALATACLRELGNYRRGEPCDERYGLELLRRATLEGDPGAWEWVQYCFHDMVRSWLGRHPSRVAALRLDSEENYVALTFGRFWQATTLTQKVEFRKLAAALRYLRASLHGAILDTLRAYSRPKEVPLPESGEPGEPSGEDQADSSEAWGILQSMLLDRRERRLAYLLYHCGLKPREILHFCPQEWSDIQEIYRLRRNIMDRLLRKRDQICWKLAMSRNYGGEMKEIK
jgi:hypothetical protein